MGKRLVLVVDEDTRTGHLLARMLVEDGYDVEVSTDGASAISRLTRGPGPDVLITDLRTPHGDGLAVARFARMQNPQIPIFIVTGYPELITPLESALTPVGHVFAKPLAYRELTAAMNGSLAGSA
jgi:DNA-binding response OmpR family regulator